MARANLSRSGGVVGSKPPRSRQQKRGGKRRTGWFSALLLELGSLALLLAIVQPTIWETWLTGKVADQVSEPTANSPTTEHEPGSVESNVDVERQQVASVDAVRHEFPRVRHPSAHSIVRSAAVPASRRRGYIASWSNASVAPAHTLPFGSAVQGRLRIPVLPGSIGGLSGY